MRGGANRKTDAQHKLAGTLDTSRHGNPDEKVGFEGGMPEPPSGLDEGARREWFRISSILKTAGLLTPAYRAAIAGYCALWSEFEANPVKFATNRHTQMRMYIDTLGLSPVAVCRISGSKAKPKGSKYEDV